MTTRYEEIRDIARASLMPDFFAVRIDEEKLYADLQHLLARIKLPAPVRQVDKIKAISAASATAIVFVDALKQANLWGTLRDILAHGQIK